MAVLDAEQQKQCFEEVSHMVLDSGRNVTLPLLSSSYGIPFPKCSEILKNWIQQNQKTKDKITTSFVVHYKDSNGVATVAILSEEKLKELKSKHESVSEMLYSVTLSTTNRTVGLAEHFPDVHVQIKVKSNVREVKHAPGPVVEPRKTYIKNETVTKAGTKNISNMFNKPSASSDSADKVVSKSEESKGALKPEKVSPVKKDSPKKKESPKKNVKPPVSAKGSIASFFNKASATKKTPVEVVHPMVSTNSSSEVKKEVSTPGSNKKRPASQETIDVDSDEQDVIPGTPQEISGRHASKKLKTTAKPKPNMKKSKKHSRISVIDDSSESENENEEDKDRERTEKEIELEIDEPEAQEEKPTTSVINVEQDSASHGKRRRKAKRQINRTYLDEEGYVVSVKEFEEYSLSEEEVEIKEEKPKPKQLPTQKEEKPATKGNAKTKQGSLLSFFSKK